MRVIFTFCTFFQLFQLTVGFWVSSEPDGAREEITGLSVGGHGVKQYLRSSPVFADYLQPDASSCHSEWETTVTEANAARERFGNPSCYSFVLEREGFRVPSLAGPILITVEDGRVVSPKYLPNLSMSGIFDLITVGLAGCPSVGPLSSKVTYGAPQGYIESLELDKGVEKGKISFQISNYTEC
jgi:hypothetical protein